MAYFVISLGMKKFISILLTILILAISTGVTYAKHYCGDFEVVSTLTMGKKNLSCGMAMEADDCDSNKENPIDCCKNTYENIDTDDNFTNSSFNLQINNSFIASFISVFVLKDIYFSDKEIHFSNGYDPPPRYNDIQVIYQVYII